MRKGVETVKRVFLHRAVLLLLPLLFLGCGGSGGDGGYGPPGDEIPLWGRFESRLDLPVPEGNPYDPDEISVDATFVAPDGRSFSVPCFVTRDFRRELSGGFERLSPSGDPEWRVRFSPEQAGSWSWRWQAVSRGGVTGSGWFRFQVGRAAPDRHGGVRVAGPGSRYLEFRDGTPFFAVGENLCWYDGRGTFAYEDWLAKLALQGVNVIRLWMPSWAFGLEWTERDRDGNLLASSLGNYGTRLGRAWQLDRVMDLAEGHGIQVMLCIQNHGAFSLIHNSEWTENPYNAENGGPLGRPRDFFTDPEANALFERRLRYIVARWGAAANLLAWELWNEADLAEQPPLADLVNWHARMAGALRSLDPGGRLITTSLSGTQTVLDTLLGTQRYGDLWRLPGIDLVQLHFYTIGEIGVDFRGLFPVLVETLRAYGKPVWIAEAGVDYRGPAETLRADPYGDGFHDLVWSGIFAGALGTGMSWWWDNVVDPQDWYVHLGAAVRFTAGVDFAGNAFELRRADAEADGRRLTAAALQGGGTVLVWLGNAEHQWFRPDDSEVRGAVLALGGLAEGSWRGTWVDTRLGNDLADVNLQVSQGTVRFEAPAFRKDVALRLERLL